MRMMKTQLMANHHSDGTGGVHSAFAWPEPGVDTCDLCGRSL